MTVKSFDGEVRSRIVGIEIVPSEAGPDAWDFAVIFEDTIHDKSQGGSVGSPVRVRVYAGFGEIGDPIEADGLVDLLNAASAKVRPVHLERVAAAEREQAEQAAGRERIAEAAGRRYEQQEAERMRIADEAAERD